MKSKLSKTIANSINSEKVVICNDVTKREPQFRQKLDFTQKVYTL